LVDCRWINESRHIRGIGRVNHDTRVLRDQRGIPIGRGEDARRFFRRTPPIRSWVSSLKISLVARWVASWGTGVRCRNRESVRCEHQSGEDKKPHRYSATRPCEWFGTNGGTVGER
jgi:hypothetical protein